MTRTPPAGASAAATWARADLARRWRWLVALGVIAGLTAGLAMAAVAGARRTVTALPRLSDQTRAADAVIFPGQVGAFQPDWGPLRDQPYVTSLARWNLAFGVVDGEEDAVFFIPSDGRWLGDVDRPVVVDGRMFDPEAADEMVIDEPLAAAEGIGVGDTINFTPYGPDQSDFEADPPNGPDITLNVVGVIRFTSQFLFQDGGFPIPSPGVLARHRDRMMPIENAHVRLADPDSDIARLQRDANDLLAPGTPILDLGAVERRVETTITVERTALLVLAALVALAGLVFVGQALGRSVAVIDDSREPLRAIGLTRSDLTTAAALPHVVVAAAGVAVAVVTAVALSPRFPIGFAGRVDPDRGVHADWTVLAPGLVTTAALLLGGVAAAAWVRSGARVGHDRQTRSATGPVARLRRALPLPLGIGVSSALDAGRGQARAPVRPALAAAVAAVLGLAAVFTVDHGLTDALSHPERVGVTWQATASPTPDYVTDAGINDAFVNQVLAQPGVEQASVMARAVLDVAGAGVPTFAVRPVEGDIDLVAISGRGPRADDEAAIGPATAAQLGVGVGDTVSVGPEAVPVRIVGETLFPPDVHAGFDEGLWVTPATLEAASPPPVAGDEPGVAWFMALRWAPGADPDEAVAALGVALAGQAFDVSSAEVPPELANLGNVAALPVVLAIFLVLLAASTLAHGLATTVRRRRPQFAVLRTLGFTPAMTRAVVGAHSTAVGVVGLAVGIPLGLTAGRLSWAWLAGEVPMLYVSPIAAALVGMLVAASLVMANLVAAVPAWWAGRLRPAEVLRTE